MVRRILVLLALVATLTTPLVASRAKGGQPRVKRSQAARVLFMRQTGYSRGRPGYVVDHIIPLACGGADAPFNMQWQTVADAKAKDKIERIGCQPPRATGRR